MLLLIALLLAADPTPPRLPTVPEAKVPTFDGKKAALDEKLDKGDDRKAAVAAQAEKKADDKKPQATSEKQADEKKADEKVAAVDDKKVTDKPATADAPPPPALTHKALCGEFAKSGKELVAARKKLEDDRKALDAEKQTLDKLKAEISDARIQLRLETERLEKLLARRAEGGAGEAEKSTTGGASEKPRPAAPVYATSELEGLAKTLKGMKPESAASLLQKTEPALAAAVLKRMKPSDAGAVMDKLKPELAAELMGMMATTAAPSKGKQL
jgi:flagellar motility protein MotE (MotC chaperone)